MISPSKFMATPSDRVQVSVRSDPTPAFPTDRVPLRDSTARKDPIQVRVELEAQAQQKQDRFGWNSGKALTTPDKFASVFCADPDIPETVISRMRAQIEKREVVVTTDLPYFTVFVG